MNNSREFYPEGLFTHEKEEVRLGGAFVGEIERIYRKGFLRTKIYNNWNYRCFIHNKTTSSGQVKFSPYCGICLLKEKGIE